MVRFLATVIIAMLGIKPLCAAEYLCQVERKFNASHRYTPEELERWQFSVRINENSDEASIDRCSFSSSAQTVTCDRYVVDKVAFDENAKIKKFYVFRSQFDVQLSSDLNFIENNGRGDIAFGECALVSP